MRGHVDSGDSNGGIRVTHPRFTQRRAEVEDQTVRRRKRRLLILIGCITFILLAAGSTQTALFDVDEVRVIGAQEQSPDLIRRVSEIEQGMALWGLETDRATERVLALPRIKEAETSSSWRGVVTIEVLERLPIARIESPEGTIVVAEDGVIIEVDEAPVSPAVTDLTEIAGAMFPAAVGESVPEVLDEAVVLATALPSDIAVVTERIEITVDSLFLRAVGGGEISLGDSRNLPAKFDAIRAFLTQVDLTCLDTLNVSAPSVPVIQRTTGC